MAKPQSCFVVVIVLLLPIVLSCSEKETVMDSYDRGVEALMNGDYDLAVTCFTEVIRLDPRDPAAYSNRGMAYDEKGEFGKAIADYTEAIRLDPNLAAAYNNRAEAHEILSRVVCGRLKGAAYFG